MQNDILKLIGNNYSLIHRKHGDYIGIPVIEEGNKALYIVKSCGEIRFATYNKVLSVGMCDDFSDTEILLALGRFVDCFEDIHKKLEYYNEVKSLMQVREKFAI